jgi:hypothetical protein
VEAFSDGLARNQDQATDRLQKLRVLLDAQLSAEKQLGRRGGGGGDEVTQERLARDTAKLRLDEAHAQLDLQRSRESIEDAQRRERVAQMDAAQREHEARMRAILETHDRNQREIGALLRDEQLRFEDSLTRMRVTTVTDSATVTQLLRTGTPTPPTGDALQRTTGSRIEGPQIIRIEVPVGIALDGQKVGHIVADHVAKKLDDSLEVSATVSDASDRLTGQQLAFRSAP